jgi:hypothetical protein
MSAPVEVTVAVEAMVTFNRAWVASLDAVLGGRARRIGGKNRQCDPDSDEGYSCETLPMCWLVHGSSSLSLRMLNGRVLSRLL